MPKLPLKYKVFLIALVVLLIPTGFALAQPTPPTVEEVCGEGFGGYALVQRQGSNNSSQNWYGGTLTFFTQGGPGQSNKYVSWTSSFDVHKVVVFTGSNQQVYNYPAGATEGVGLSVVNDPKSAITRVLFCWEGDDPGPGPDPDPDTPSSSTSTEPGGDPVLQFCLPDGSTGFFRASTAGPDWVEIKDGEPCGVILPELGPIAAIAPDAGAVIPGPALYFGLGMSLLAGLGFALRLFKRR